MVEIAVAVITGIAAVLGVVISNRSSNQKINHQMEVWQAVMNTKIESLTGEVREHNNYAKRMPVAENDIAAMKKEIAELKKELAELKKYHMQ